MVTDTSQQQKTKLDTHVRTSSGKAHMLAHLQAATISQHSTCAAGLVHIHPSRPRMQSTTTKHISSREAAI